MKLVVVFCYRCMFLVYVPQEAQDQTDDFPAQYLVKLEQQTFYCSCSSFNYRYIKIFYEINL